MKLSIILKKKGNGKVKHLNLANNKIDFLNK